MPNRNDTENDTLADHAVPDDDNRKTLTDIEYQRTPRDTEPNPFANAADTEIAPVTDELDLHTFQPSECADLVEEYVRAAHEQGLVSVRIVHGKGTGTLRRIVQAVLERHPAVASFTLGDEHSGSWGATLVQLKPR